MSSASSDSTDSGSEASSAPSRRPGSTVPIDVEQQSESSPSSDESDDDASAAQQEEEEEEEVSGPAWSKPKGFDLVLPDERADTPFDWSTLASDPDLELWMIKVPQGVRLSLVHKSSRMAWLTGHSKQIKAKHLTELSVPVEASTSKHPKSLSSFHAKKADYSLVEVPSAENHSETGPHDNPHQELSSELSNLHPLLPSQQAGGKLKLSQSACMQSMQQC